MSEGAMSLSDVTVRTVRPQSGEGPVEIVGSIDALVGRMSRRWPGLEWEIPYAGSWSGPVSERQRLVASRVAGDVDEHAVPERGAAFGVTSAGGGFRFHLIVTAGAPVVGERSPLQRVSLRVVSIDGSDISQEIVDELMGALVTAWRPVMAVATSRDFALADPVAGWTIPTGLMLWLAGSGMRLGGSTSITVHPAGPGVLLKAAPGLDVTTITTDMRRILDDAGLFEVSP